jgi:di/tricarboxylate transporter
MLVQPGCRLVGQSVETAGLRHLPGLFLIEVDRAGTIIAPVSPEEVILAHDRLVFTGIVSTIVDLERVPGFVPAADTAYEFSPERQRGRRLCEAVISPSSPLVGKTIRSANFRALYDSAVVAVHRNGARLTRKLGDVVLHSGDTLLLQVGPRFSEIHRNNPDFYLVSDVEGSRPLRHDRAGMAIALFAGMILIVTLNWATAEVAAFLVAGLMIATRCISIADARQSVELQVLVAIAGAFGIGSALTESKAAQVIVAKLVGAAHDLGPDYGPLVALATLYLVTMLVNELITNNAAAVLIFPFCLETAVRLGVSERPFVMALTLAASAAFASPVGYQTHMMVYGPGGYRFADFMRVGLPLNLILWIVALILVPFFWPFHP